MGGTSWNLDRDTFQPIGSLSYSDTLGEDRLEHERIRARRAR